MRHSKAAWFLSLLVTFAFAVVPNTPAPDFSGKTLDGKTVRLSDFRGKVVLVDFWASWCGPCKEEFPFLVKLHEALKEKSFTVLGVNVDTDVEAMQRFLDKQTVKPGFPIIHDGKGEIPELYNIKGMPTTIIIDRKGTIRYMHTGFTEKERKQILQELKTLL